MLRFFLPLFREKLGKHKPGRRENPQCGLCGLIKKFSGYKWYKRQQIIQTNWFKHSRECSTSGRFAEKLIPEESQEIFGTY